MVKKFALPLDVIEVDEGEALMILGGTTSPNANNGCDCECGCNDNNGCNCKCGRPEIPSIDQDY